MRLCHCVGRFSSHDCFPVSRSAEAAAKGEAAAATGSPSSCWATVNSYSVSWVKKKTSLQLKQVS